MKFEPLDIVCPNCGNKNYMRLMIGKNVGKLDVKCINCNSYFNFDALYNQKISEILKPKQTNADRIRAMTDEELAIFLQGNCTFIQTPCKESCTECWLEWLKQECEE